MSVELSALFVFLTIWFGLISIKLVSIHNAVCRTNKILDKIFKVCSVRQEVEQDE